MNFLPIQNVLLRSWNTIFMAYLIVDKVVRRFRFRRRGPRINFNRTRRIVKAVSGHIEAKRMLISGLSIPDVSAADWDNPLQINLAECMETMGEADVADGTNVPDVPLYSRLVGLKLDFKILGSTSTTNVYRWMLHKLPDGEELVTDATRLIGNFHTSADTVENREFRKMQMAKGMVISNPSSAVTGFRVFVRKSAMNRVASMREQDVIRFDIAKDTAGTTSILHGMGTLYFRVNA